ncbi:MAG: alpha/beta hydrolase [Planctomycetales bacterium]
MRRSVTGFWTAGLVFLAGLSLISAGCAPFLGGLIASSPNRINPLADTRTTLSPPARRVLGIDQQFRVKVPDPEASLAVSVIEPVDQDVPHGTILVVHGVWDESLWMLGTAKMLAEEGYRAVLVDLRGHGRSSGEWMSFGIQEAADLSHVIDALEERRLVEGAVGVWGISYGATTSIHLAGRDPRIKAVVAVAPFSNMRDVIPDYSRTILPGVGGLISDDLLQEAITEAGKQGNFDPDHADAVAAIQSTDAPVLLLHGEEDWMVSPYHSQRLHAAARDHSELVKLPKIGHVAIWFDSANEVQSRTKAWFDRWLKPSEVALADAAK